MADLDPIRQLQNLLDDPGKVLEKISNIQSVIGAMKGDEAAPPSSPPSASPANASLTASQGTDHPFDRLLQALREMQLQIDQRLRPLALKAIETEAAYLRSRGEQDQSALRECLGRIDRSIAACLRRVDEGQQANARLVKLNRRLAELGANTQALPHDLCRQEPVEIIESRIRYLRQAGKL